MDDKLGLGLALTNWPTGFLPPTSRRNESVGVNKLYKPHNHCHQSYFGPGLWAFGGNKPFTTSPSSWSSCSAGWWPIRIEAPSIQPCSLFSRKSLLGFVMKSTFSICLESLLVLFIGRPLFLWRGRKKLQKYQQQQKGWSVQLLINYCIICSPVWLLGRYKRS